MTSELKTAVAGFLEHRRALGLVPGRRGARASAAAALRRTARGEPPRPAHHRPARRLPGLPTADAATPSSTSSASSRDCSTGPSPSRCSMPSQCCGRTGGRSPPQRAAVPVRHHPGTPPARCDRRVAGQPKGCAPRANPPHRVRAVLRARAARRRSVRAAAGRRGRRPCPARGARRQVRQDRLVPHGPRIGALLRAQLDYRRTAVAASEMDAPLFAGGGGACIPARPAGVPPPRRRSRPSRHRRGQSAAVALAAAFLRGRVPAALVSRRPRSAARLLQLSTFMGHVDPQSTAVYLQITRAAHRGHPPLRGVR